MIWIGGLLGGIITLLWMILEKLDNLERIKDSLYSISDKLDNLDPHSIDEMEDL